MSQTTETIATAFPDHYTTIARSFRRDLEASNKSPNTIDTYMRAVSQLGTFLTERGMPTASSAITREHIQEYLAALRDRNKASSINTRFRSLQQFFRWLVEEGRSRNHRWPACGRRRSPSRRRRP